MLDPYWQVEIRFENGAIATMGAQAPDEWHAVSRTIPIAILNMPISYTATQIPARPDRKGAPHAEGGCRA